jgi:hypothetical protein
VIDENVILTKAQPVLVFKAESEVTADAKTKSGRVPGDPAESA